MSAFSFNGRIGRLDYFIVFVLCLIFLKSISGINEESIITEFKPSIISLFKIPLLWVLWAEGAKRCHDIGVSGWMQIIPFYFLWMLFKKGDVGNNRYGLDPKLKDKWSNKPRQNPPTQTNDISENKNYNTDESNDIISTSIETNAIISDIATTKPSWFKQAIDYLTFDTPTFRSVFDEGQRRVVLVLSFIIPFISSYVMLRDWEDGYIDYDDEFVGYYLISYLMYFVILLIYIWIREGSGNVRPGGNAGKSLWNMAKVGLISFFIVAAVGISYNEYENYKEKKRIEEDRLVVLEKAEIFVSCIFAEEITCMKELTAQNKINEVLNRMEETFRDYDFRNGQLKNVSFEKSNTIPWFYYVAGQLDYSIKPTKKKEFSHKIKNIRLTFDSKLEIIGHSIDE